MENIKKTILEKAKELFNEKGVAQVSIREISRAVGISHSNLIYHFKDKNVLLNSLHQQILDSAIALNKEIAEEKNTLRSLFVSTTKGFALIYDYRFFMIDFNLILKENHELHEQIKNIEQLRFQMYEEKISQMIEQKVLRSAKYANEYSDLITKLRIYSDYWVSSAQVYEENPKSSIMKYAKLFLTMFYPYLTEKGRINFDELIVAFGLE